MVITVSAHNFKYITTKEDHFRHYMAIIGSKSAIILGEIEFSPLFSWLRGIGFDRFIRMDGFRECVR